MVDYCRCTVATWRNPRPNKCGFAYGIRAYVRETADDASYIADAEKAHLHFVAEPGSRGYAYVRSVFRKPLMAMFAMCGGICCWNA